VVLLFTGCTTIRWHDPANPDGPPVFEYKSGKDVSAEGLLVEVTYHDNGTLASVHVEFGHVSGTASDVIAEYNSIVEAATRGAVAGLKIGAGIP